MTITSGLTVGADMAILEDCSAYDLMICKSFIPTYKCEVTMRKAAPINIIVHYPKTEEGMRELRRRVAIVHADVVFNKIQKLDWPLSEKIRLVEAIIADVKAEIAAEQQEKNEGDQA